MKKVNGWTVTMRKNSGIRKQDGKGWNTYRIATSGLMRKTWKEL